MMNDAEYSELKLRAMIVPKQASWPAPELVHWQRLHAAADEAREAVRTAYRRMDEIDRSAHLSREDKARQRHRVATQVFAEFEASKTLARAREAVGLAVAKYNVEQHVSPEIAEARDATLKAMNEAEAGWQRAMDKIAERASLARPWTRKPAAIGGWLA
jgi:hypothetical protein